VRRAVGLLGVRFADYVLVSGEFASAPFLPAVGDLHLRVVARLKGNLPTCTNPLNNVFSLSLPRRVSGKAGSGGSLGRRRPEATCPIMALNSASGAEAPPKQNLNHLHQPPNLKTLRSASARPRVGNYGCCWPGKAKKLWESPVILSRHFILDISFGRGVNGGGAKPFVSRVVPAEREHVGACNEEAAGSIDFYFLDSYRQTLCRASQAAVIPVPPWREESTRQTIGNALSTDWIPPAERDGNDRHFERGPVPNDTNTQRKKLQSSGGITVFCIDILFLGFPGAT
jgi:hypothetical protein